MVTKFFTSWNSCYLLTIKEDSVDGIYETIKRCALVSRGASGLGVAVHSVRASGSTIHGVSDLMIFIFINTLDIKSIFELFQIILINFFNISTRFLFYYL